MDRRVHIARGGYAGGGLDMPDVDQVHGAGAGCGDVDRDDGGGEGFL